LHSNRADVERLLSESQDPCKCIYRTADDVVQVGYAVSPCKGYPFGWNVAKDTVLFVSVSSKDQPWISDLHVNTEEFGKSSDDSGTIYFINKKEGIKYEVSHEGRVSSISYLPSSDDSDLRCPGFPPYDGGLTEYSPFARFRRKDDEKTWA